MKKEDLLNLINSTQFSYYKAHGVVTLYDADDDPELSAGTLPEIVEQFPFLQIHDQTSENWVPLALGLLQNGLDFRVWYVMEGTRKSAGYAAYKCYTEKDAEAALATYSDFEERDLYVMEEEIDIDREIEQ